VQSRSPNRERRECRTVISEWKADRSEKSKEQRLKYRAAESSEQRQKADKQKAESVATMDVSTLLCFCASKVLFYYLGKDFFNRSVVLDSSSSKGYVTATLLKAHSF
jgi:hypothetical protein